MLIFSPFLQAYVLPPDSTRENTVTDTDGKEAAPPRRRSPHRDRDYNARSDITQRGVDRRREEREDRGDLEYDDRNEPIGEPCFSRAI